jgi:hypothetical protein
MCVFPLALDALRASVDVQSRLRSPSDSQDPLPLGVGIGIDVGEAVPMGEGYRGAALNVAARLCAVARPGQILATETAVRLAGGMSGAHYAPRRPIKLKGLRDPVRLVEILPDTPLPPLPEPPGRRRSRRKLLVSAAVALACLAATVAAFLETRPGEHKEPSAAPKPIYEGIFRIDAASEQLKAIRLPPTPQISPDLEYGLGYVWARYEGSPTRPGGLAKIDAATGKVVEEVPLHGLGPIAIAGGKLYSSGGEIGTNNLMVFDPSNLNGLAEIIPTQPFDPEERQAGLYPMAGFGSIWLRESGAPGCCTGRVFWRIDLESHKVIGRWPNPDSLAVGPEGVWFVRGQHLYRIDPKTNLKISLSEVGKAWTVAVGGGAVWVGDVSGHLLRELNPATGALVWRRRLPGIQIAGMVAGGGYVWLEDVADRKLVRVSALQHQISRAIEFHTTPGPMTVSPGAIWIRFPRSEDAYRNGDVRY